MPKDWTKYDKDEVEKLVKKLAKEVTPGKIGLILRDQYGIGSVKKYGFTISSLTSKKEEVPEDLYDLLKKVVNLHDHMQKNKKDHSSKYGLQALESKIRRLGKYYIRTGRLPKDWKYTIQSARLLVK